MPNAMDNESAEYLRTPDWYYDQVKCEACGRTLDKTEAVRMPNGDWLCQSEAEAITEMCEGRI